MKKIKNCECGVKPDIYVSQDVCFKEAKAAYKYVCPVCKKSSEAKYTPNEAAESWNSMLIDRNK